MKTIYFAATSLDGYIADKNNSLDWLFQFGAPPEGMIERFVDSIGAIAMGSTTYEWLLAHHHGPWPYHVPCFVFTSRQLPVVSNADIRMVSGDVLPVHQEMVKLAQNKDVWLMGGGDLVGQFYDQNLLQEMQLQVVSVTLGEGAPMFPRYTHKPLKLVEVKQVGEAMVALTYKVGE